MAINKKGSKVSKPGYPSEFVALVTKAAEMQSGKDYFERQYDDARTAVATYLDAEDCPVIVNVGEKGGSPKVDGVATVIVSQPERVDNAQAKEVLVNYLIDGKINPADLVEIITTVNVSALRQVLEPSVFATLVKKDDEGNIPVQIAVRTAAEFKISATDALKAKLDK